PAIPRLLKNVMGQNAEMRQLSSEALSRFNISFETSNRLQVVECLRQLLFDSEVEVRMNAVSVLAELGEVESLRACFADTSPMVLLQVGRLLWKHTHAAGDIPSVLEDALSKARAKNQIHS